MRQYIGFFSTCLLLLASGASVQGQSKLPLYEDYIKKYKAIAMQHQRDYKIPASITLAQGLLESAAGDSYLARKGNNHFGIKCKQEWSGGRIYYDDDAEDECFRKYSNAEESYKDHALFLTNRSHYASLFSLDISDYKGWAYGLQKCGYATDKKYGEKLVSLIETYELYKYDKGTTDKARISDDIYEIKIGFPEKSQSSGAATKMRRKMHINNDVHYIVAQENDSYDKIAKDLNVSVRKLLKYNEAPKGRKLEKGDAVYLQKKKKYASKAHKTHVVVEGESLYSISQLYGMRFKSLYKLNKLENDYIPKPGDLLKVRKR